MPVDPISIRIEIFLDATCELVVFELQSSMVKEGVFLSNWCIDQDIKTINDNTVRIVVGLTTELNVSVLSNAHGLRFPLKISLALYRSNVPST